MKHHRNQCANPLTPHYTSKAKFQDACLSNAFYKRWRFPGGARAYCSSYSVPVLVNLVVVAVRLTEVQGTMSLQGHLSVVIVVDNVVVRGVTIVVLVTVLYTVASLDVVVLTVVVMDVMAGRTGLSLEWLVLGQLFDEQRRGQQFAEEQKKEDAR